MVDYDVIVKGNSLSLREGYLALANATLVFTPDGPVLFDVGHYVNRPALINGLARHDLAPGDVRAVFLSHLHFDHCNNIDLFPGARVYLSKREWDYAKAPHADDWFVPWLIHEQLQKHEVEFLDGEGRIADGVRYLPTPGHTPGSYALALDTDKHGCVVIAGDAIKFAKELIRGQCDMAFDSAEAGSASIAKIAAMADRIVPGHFPELVREGDKFVWTEAAEFPLLIR